jgi:hypothetical protein
MNRRFLFSFLVNNGTILQKCPVAIVLKSLFEEILVKGKTAPAFSFREACRLSELRADRTADNTLKNETGL